MKKYLLLLFFAPLFLSAQDTRSALFLGNSYTSYNNLYDLVDSIASNNGDDLIHDFNTPGGHTLNQHTTNPTSLAEIKLRDWDFVVLQEQSQMPSFPPAQVATDVKPYAAILNDSIKANNVCTETLFYMTWGRENGDQSNCADYAPLCTYEGMQQRLRESYLEMANENAAAVAPVGVAWKRVREEFPAIQLYTADESHPSAEGSYLAACVFYSTMFQKSCIGNPFTFSLDSADAANLQMIASETVLDSLDLWRIGANDLTINLGNDTTTCLIDSIVLIPNSSSQNITWQDGSVDSIFVATQSGVYTAMISNIHTCQFLDSITISLSENTVDTIIYSGCDSVLLNGNVFYMDTIIVDTFSTMSGCDSIVVSEIVIRIAPPVIEFGEYYSQNGLYYQEIIVFNEDSVNIEGIYPMDIQLPDSIQNGIDLFIYFCDVENAVYAYNSCGIDSFYRYEPCASIGELDKSYWQISPNPTQNFVNIHSLEDVDFVASLMNVQGQVLLENLSAQDGNLSLNLQDFSSGMYFLVLYDEQKNPIGQTQLIKK